jgi:hypothetical protein
VNRQKAAFQNYNAQLLYKKTFPKIGKELTVDGNYNYTTSKNGYVFEILILYLVLLDKIVYLQRLIKKTWDQQLLINLCFKWIT